MCLDLYHWIVSKSLVAPLVERPLNSKSLAGYTTAPSRVAEYLAWQKWSQHKLLYGFNNA